MKKVLIIDPDVPQEDKPEGLAVYKAITTGECNVCPYLKRCENDGSFKFPSDAACMKILNMIKN
jgi:hypothetical protein